MKFGDFKVTNSDVLLKTLETAILTNSRAITLFKANSCEIRNSNSSYIYLTRNNR